MTEVKKIDPLAVLKGKTLDRIAADLRGNEILFFCSDGSQYKMYHDQDCCEVVTIEDICGSLDSLIGAPVLVAETRTSQDGPKEPSDESFTWTFYEMATIKGSVSIRWYGESNGYYSEEVDFERICEPAYRNNDTSVFKSHYDELLKLYTFVRSQSGPYSVEYLAEKIGGMLLDVPLTLGMGILNQYEKRKMEFREGRLKFGKEEIEDGEGDNAQREEDGTCKCD